MSQVLSGSLAGTLGVADPSTNAVQFGVNSENIIRIVSDPQIVEALDKESFATSGLKIDDFEKSR